MRILHTSDWHLGQCLHGKERTEEHQRFLDWLHSHLVQAKEEGDPYQALLVAGDIFDVSNPSGEARAQYHRFLARLYRDGVCPNVVIVAGNHDSPMALDATSEVLRELNVAVVGQSRNPKDDLVELRGWPREDGSGQSQPGERIGIVCAAPFLRGEAIHIQDGESLADAIRKSTQAYFAEALNESLAVRGDTQIPIIAMGHLWATGAHLGGSEREIQVGQLDQFGAEAFKGFDYVALGHIHRPQQVGGCEHIRYCGSPLPLSFTEADQKHCVVSIRLEGGQLLEVEEVEVPLQRRLSRLQGTLPEILNRLQEPPEPSAGLPAFLEITVRLETVDPSAAGQVREAVKAAGLELASLRVETPELRARIEEMERQVQEFGELSPLSVLKLLTRDLPELEARAMETLFCELVRAEEVGR